MPVSDGIEIRHGCQFVSSLVRALAKLPGGIGRFLPCSLGCHLSRLRHLGWNHCSHGLFSRPLESCHHQCLKAVCGVLGYPKGSASELLDGALNLRHCTYVFTMRFPPWSLPRVGNGCGERQFVTPGHLLDEGSNVGKRVPLTRKTRPGVISHYSPDPGASNAEAMEKIAPPFLRRSGGTGGRASQSFSSTWSWVSFCNWGRLEPAFGGNRRSGFPAGQSSRRGQCAGTSSFLFSCTLFARMVRHTRNAPRPHHHYHHTP